MISRDSNLQKLITTCRQQIPPAESIRSWDDVITSAMANTVELVKGSVFFYLRCMTHSVNLPEDLFTSRWIQSNLTVHLQHHMTYSCRVHKNGTTIYRPHSDLILSLSQALWELHNIKK